MTVRKTYCHISYMVHHVSFSWLYTKGVAPLWQYRRINLNTIKMQELNFNERKEWAKEKYIYLEQKIDVCTTPQNSDSEIS